MKAVSTIGPKTVIRGNVHGEGDLSIEGRVEGDVNVDGNVTVAPMAEVKGSITAANVSVAGTVEGDVSATDTLTVDPNAKILGDMTGPRVHIAEGAVVRGMVRTEGEPRRAAPERLTRETPEAATKQRKNDEKLPRLLELASESLAAIQDEPPRDKPHKKHKDKHKKKKRPPEPVVPVLAKRTKGKKKGEKRAP